MVGVGYSGEKSNCPQVGTGVRAADPFSPEIDRDEPGSVWETSAMDRDGTEVETFRPVIGRAESEAGRAELEADGFSSEMGAFGAESDPFRPEAERGRSEGLRAEEPGSSRPPAGPRSQHWNVWPRVYAGGC